jgi:hypothetical protein
VALPNAMAPSRTRICMIVGCHNAAKWARRSSASSRAAVA